MGAAGTEEMAERKRLFFGEVKDSFSFLNLDFGLNRKMYPTKSYTPSRDISFELKTENNNRR